MKNHQNHQNLKGGRQWSTQQPITNESPSIDTALPQGRSPEVHQVHGCTVHQESFQQGLSNIQCKSNTMSSQCLMISKVTCLSPFLSFSLLLPKSDQLRVKNEIAAVGDLAFNGTGGQATTRRRQQQLGRRGANREAKRRIFRGRSSHLDKPD